MDARRMAKSALVVWLMDINMVPSIVGPFDNDDQAEAFFNTYLTSAEQVTICQISTPTEVSKAITDIKIEGEGQ